MAFSGLQQGILLRVMGLLGTLALLAWMTVSLITMAAVAALPGPLVSPPALG